MSEGRSRIDDLRESLEASSRKASAMEARFARTHARFGLLRLLAFASLAGFFIATATLQDETYAAYGILPSLAALAILIIIHRPTRRGLGRARRIIALLEAKRKRVESATPPDYDPAERFGCSMEELVQDAIAPSHMDADDNFLLPTHTREDLGLFSGKHCVLGTVDSTSTRLGTTALIRRLTNTSLDPRVIDERQQGTRELLDERHVRHRLEQVFSAHAGYPTTEQMAFLSKDNYDLGSARHPRSVPFYTLGVCAVLVWSIVSTSFLIFLGGVLLAAIGNIVLAGPRRKTTGLRIGSEAHRRLIDLVAEVEGIVGEMQSPHMVRLRDSLHRLSSHPDLPGFRRSMWALGLYRAGLFYVILDWLLLYDLYFVVPVSRFWTEARGTVMGAYRALGEIEASISFANSFEEHPHRTWPSVIGDGPPHLEIDDASHPVLSRTLVVTNSIALGDVCRTSVITGSNMSGKSTFIRTCGVALVLAQAGGPAPATRMKWTPLRLLSDINIVDSLDSGESFFSVEVDRVKAMLDLADETPFCLFLLDEVFRGTNTNEKVAAGREVVRHLGKSGALSIVATHDHEFTELETSDPSLLIRNHHFIDHVEDGRMTFSYKLHRGPAQTRNAISLLKHRGYPEELVRRALDSSHGSDGNNEKTT